MTTPKNNRKKEPYRFALVGSTASGKTCILAQLAYGTDCDPRFSTHISSLDERPLSVDEERLKDSDPEVRRRKNYQSGKEQINAAREAIQAGRCPAPTPPQEEARMMVDFVMGDEERGEFYIRTEDYSGEKISIANEALSDPNSSTYQLSERLSGYDGLIFIVETFLPGESQEQTREVVDNLSTFFTEIRKKNKVDTLNLPVALVFSKWDKYSEIDCANPQAEDAKFAEYRQQPEIRFYDNLYKSMRNMTVEQSDSEQSENYRVFPVSAFGRAHFQNGVYLPEVGAEAYGIVAPFLWLANRRDELDMAQIRGDAEKIPHVATCYIPCRNKNKETRRIKTRAEFLQNRVSRKNAPFQTELREIEKKAGRFMRHMWYACVVKCFLIIAAIYYGWVTKWYYQYKHDVNRPSTDIAELSRIEGIAAWRAEHLSFLPNISHLSRNLLEQIATEKEARYWAPVEKAVSGSRDQYEKAREYVAQFPGGAHRKDAETIVATYVKQLDDDYWEPIAKAWAKDDMETACPLTLEYLRRIEAGEIKGEHRVEAEMIIEYYPIWLDNKAWEPVQQATLDGKPVAAQARLAEEYIDFLNKNRHRDLPRAHELEANQIIVESKKAKDWADALAGYLASSTILESSQRAAALLDYEAGLWEPVIKKYPEKLNGILQTQKGAKQDQIKQCDHAIQTLETLENSVRERSAQTAEGLLNAQVGVRKYRKTLVDQLDRELYDELRSYGSKDRCVKYLDTMEKYGGGAMEAEVRRLAEYFDSLKVSARFKGTASVTWGNKITNHTADLTLNVGSDAKTTKVDRNDGKTEQLDNFEFTAIPEKSVTVRVVVISKRNTSIWGMGWDNDVELHSGTKTVSMKAWSEGPVTIDIGKDSKVTLNKLTSGFPLKPQLPEWSGK